MSIKHPKVPEDLTYRYYSTRTKNQSIYLIESIDDVWHSPTTLPKAGQQDLDDDYQDSSFGWLKIGVSNNVYNRMKSVSKNTWMGRNNTLVLRGIYDVNINDAYFNDICAIEYELHNHFGVAGTESEWFPVSWIQVKKFIKNYMPYLNETQVNNEKQTVLDGNYISPKHNYDEKYEEIKVKAAVRASYAEWVRYDDIIPYILWENKLTGFFVAKSKLGIMFPDDYYTEDFWNAVCPENFCQPEDVGVRGEQLKAELFGYIHDNFGLYGLK